MRLRINGQVQTGSAALSDAFRSSAPPLRQIEMDDGNSLAMLAMARDDGRFDVAFVEQEVRKEAQQPASIEDVSLLFQLFAARDPKWRYRIGWRAASPPKDPKPQSPEPTRKRALSAREERRNTFIGIGVMATFAMLPLAQIMGWRLSLPTFKLPPLLQSVGAQVIAMFVGLVFTLVLIAVLIKLHEVRQARSWSSAVGTIVSSRMGVETHEGADGDTRIRNVPMVEYIFLVGDRRYRGSRLTFAEREDSFTPAEIAARYPPGSSVTVYFDPADPERCVLDREFPEVVTKGCAFATLVLFAMVLGLLWFASNGPALISTTLPESNPYIFIASVGAALLLAMLMAADRRRRQAARGWKATPGTVVRSEIEWVRTSSEGPSSSAIPFVQYRYIVDGHEYHARQITLDMSHGGAESVAQRQLRPYPVGAAVTVYYDPDNPSDAVLVVRTEMHWVMPAIFGLLAALAIWSSGVF